MPLEKTLTEIFGTAFLVHDTWYLRYLDGGGAMVPIEGPAAIKEKLADGQSVRINGYMSTDGRGCARSVQAANVEVLGSGKTA